jgi:hypothetical protein
MAAWIKSATHCAWLPSVVQRSFTLARESDIMFAVVQRTARRDATMAVVTHRNGAGGRRGSWASSPKEHTTDSVARASSRSGDVAPSRYSRAFTLTSAIEAWQT